MSEALFTERNIFEGMTSQHITEYIIQQSEKIAEAERLMRLANDVLNANGTTIDEQLDLMNETNTQTISFAGH